MARYGGTVASMHVYLPPFEIILMEIPDFVELRVMQALLRTMRPRAPALLIASLLIALSFCIPARTSSFGIMGQGDSASSADDSKAGNRFPFPTR